MGLLEDIMKALDRIPAWKRLQQLPDEVARLERRVKQLESQLEPGGNKCPKCGAMTFMLQSSRPMPGGLGHLGVLQDQMRCTSCGHEEHRTRDSMRS